MKIKTYPLQFTEEYLKHIEEVAKKQGKTIKDFILEAIKEKIERRWFFLNNYNVYKHTFPDGKIYIGVSTNPLKRWSNGHGYYFNEETGEYALLDTFDKCNVKELLDILNEVSEWNH